MRPSSSSSADLLLVKSVASERERGGERETRNYRAGSSRDNTRHRINVGAAGNSHLIITGRMLTHRIRWSDLITAPSDRVSANKRSRVSREVASARADNIFINDLSRVIELMGRRGRGRRATKEKYARVLLFSPPFLSYLILSRLELSRAEGKRKKREKNRRRNSRLEDATATTNTTTTFNHRLLSLARAFSIYICIAFLFRSILFSSPYFPCGRWIVVERANDVARRVSPRIFSRRALLLRRLKTFLSRRRRQRWWRQRR